MANLDTPIRIVGFLFFALLIFVMFVGFLISATAQQKITENLKGIESELSYSEAYNLMEQRKELKASSAASQKNLDVLKVDLNAVKNQISSIELKTEENAVREVEAVSAAKLPNWCPQHFTKNEPLNSRIILEKIATCIKEGQAEENVKKPYLDLKTYVSRNSTFSRNVLLLEKEKAALEIRVEGLQDQFKQYQLKMVLVDKIEPAFLPKLVLQKILPFGVLFSVPPSVVPILLTCVSGLFGALLINMILVVYPHNNYGLEHTSSFYQHVLLGGLISTAVFVVLGAGSSVLGFAGGGVGDPRNFLSFSAVGLFSGMFSNRAADWLSKQADFFTESNGKAS